MIVLCVILFLCLTILGCLCLSITTVSVKLSSVGGDQNGVADVRALFGLVRWHKELLKVETAITSEGAVVQTEHRSHVKKKSVEKSATINLQVIFNVLDDWPHWVHLVSQMKRIVGSLFTHVKVSKLQVYLVVGSTDVISTGMLSGMTWAILTTVIGRLSHLCKFESLPDFKVNTNWNRPELSGGTECILHVRSGYAIIAGLRLVGVWKRRKTNGSSNSRAHANSHGKHT